MKKLVLSLMMVGACVAASAQENPVKLGIKAGVNFPSVSADKDLGDAKAITSFYLGGTVELPVGGMFSIQPGIILSGKGFKEKESGTFDDVTGSVEAKLNLMYIEIPVNALVSFPAGEGRVFLGAGPYVGMALSGKHKYETSFSVDGETSLESSEEDAEFGDDGNFKRFDFGVNFLGGFELSNGLNIHAGYGLGLSTIAQNSELKVNNRVLSVGVGFSF